MVENKELLEELIFTVHCVNGEKIVHRYNVPETRKELEKFIKHTIEMITAAFTGKLTMMYFNNPCFHYNSKNVVGVEFNPISIGEFETLIEEAQKSIGFKKS